MRGFVYCVTSLKYVKPLVVAVYSLRQFHDEPITVRTSVKLPPLGDVDLLPIKPHGSGQPRTPHRMAKLQAIIESPYEQTLYMDADTMVMGKLDEWWTDGWKFAQIGKRKQRFTERALINAGVIGYGTDRALAERVKKALKADGKGDQKWWQKYYEVVTILDERWNLCPNGWDRVDDPRLVHFVGERWIKGNIYAPIWKKTYEQAQAYFAH